MTTKPRTKPQRAALTLCPDLQNPNRMDPEDKARMAKSLAEFGDLSGVVLNRRTGLLIGGHQRVDVLAGATVEAWDNPLQADGTPYVEPDGTVGRGYLIHGGRQYALRVVDWSEDKAHAALLAANRFGRVGQDDAALLKDLLQELDTGAMDMDLTGYTTEAIESLMLQVHQEDAADAEPQLDRADELRKEWGVKAGDLWTCGPHRILCGDSTKAADVARLMDGERAQIVFTSPPYWVGFEYENENKWSEVLSFISKFAELYSDCVQKDGRIIINTGTSQAAHLTGKPAHMKLIVDEWVRAFESSGWLMRYVRFWVKDGGLLHTAPQSDCIDQHTEFLAYFYNPGKVFRGVERTGEPWACKGYWSDIPGAARASGHIAAFPIELPKRNILLFTRPGEAVIEPFLGSGTTLIACEQLGRKCYGIEIAPSYVAVILQRYLDATGKRPERIDA